MSNAVKKALSLLKLVSAGNRTLSELSASAEIPKSTVYRLAETLMSEGYLLKDDHGYRLGYRLLELGEVLKGENYLVAAAREPMEQLSSKTKETVHLGQLDGTDIIYIDKVDGTRGLQMVSRVGLRTMAQSTSLGKVLIAGLPEAQWREHLIEGAERRTPNTIVDLNEIVEELRRVRDAGYALDREENELGIRCVACPIRDYSGQVVAAISLSGATVYVTEERQEALIAHVAETATTISSRLGHPSDQ